MFNKDYYILYTCGIGLTESKRASWDKMDKLTGNKHNYSVTVLEAQKNSEDLSVMMF